MSAAKNYYVLRRPDGMFVVVELDGCPGSVPVWSNPADAVEFWATTMPPCAGPAEVRRVRDISRFVAVAASTGTATIYDLVWDENLDKWAFSRATHPVEA